MSNRARIASPDAMDGRCPPSRSPALLVPYGLRIGDALAGKYRVEGVLGSGGMGVVLLALQHALNRKVAVKVLHPELGQVAVHVERFLREAKAAAMLRSEHVVRIFDVDRTEMGLTYLVMEWLDGQDLRQVLLERGPLPVSEAVGYILQTCSALAEAHKVGIVHRDLKLANLFLTRSAEGLPVVKVLDFGISKIYGSGGDVELTTTAMLLGTPYHMSPEQVRDARNTDARSDLWSLGTVLYEMLAGRPPFVAEHASALAAMIAADPPTPLSQWRVDVPAGLQEVIAKCLEKDRSLRFQTVAELEAALTPYAHAQAEHAVATTPRAPSPTDASGFQLSPRGGNALERTLTRAADAVPMMMPSQPGSHLRGSGASYEGSSVGNVTGSSGPSLGGSVGGFGATQRPHTAPAGSHRRAWIAGGVALVCAVAVGFWALRAPRPPTPPVQATSAQRPSPQAAPEVVPQAVQVVPLDSPTTAPAAEAPTDNASALHPGSTQEATSQPSPVAVQSSSSPKAHAEPHRGAVTTRPASRQSQLPSPTSSSTPSSSTARTKDANVAAPTSTQAPRTTARPSIFDGRM